MSICNINIHNNFFETFTSSLDLLINPSMYINIIDFNKIPIINIDSNTNIYIKYSKNNYIFTKYFNNMKDKKHGYFLYSLIINLHISSYTLYGGQIRKFFSNEEITDLDFCGHCGYLQDLSRMCENDDYNTNIQYIHYIIKKIINNNNIYAIIYILYKIIYIKPIKCNYINSYYDINKILNYRLSFDNLKIDINYKNVNKINYDFYENMLYIDNNLEISSAKEYEYNKKLILSLISLFIPNNDLISTPGILINILEMLGDNFLCVLESIYHITKHKLRLSHDNCFHTNDSNYILKKLKYIDKIIYYRIPKFINMNYEIIYINKCSNNNCISFISEIVSIYKKQKYVVNYLTFAEKKYTEKYKELYTIEYLSHIEPLYDDGQHSMYISKISNENYDFSYCYNYYQITKKQKKLSKQEYLVSKKNSFFTKKIYSKKIF